MRIKTISLLLPALLCLCVCSSGAEVLPWRWVFVESGDLGRPAEVQRIKQIVTTAGQHGLNGMVLTAGFDQLDLQGEDYFKGLAEVKATCESQGVEIIPLVFSVGYGSTLAQDPNLAAGLPVRDQLFVAGETEAHIVSDEPVGLVNGGFEELKDGKVAGFVQPDSLDRVISQDSSDFKEGKVSLCFRNFAGFGERPAMLKQKVKVKPWRCYVVSCWVKTDRLAPGRCFSMQALGKDRMVGEYIPRWGDTNDWTRLALGFNSWGNDEIEISVGTPGAKEGRFWIDGLEIEEVGLVNVLRRPGAPLTVSSEAAATVYEEGRDYLHVEDPQMDQRFEHDGPPIKLAPQSRITPGERLRVSYYHGSRSVPGKEQITTCPSEEKVYEIWAGQARLMAKYVGAKKFFLDMDEIRAGGTCKACTDRGLSLGEMLGDCITRQYKLLTEANPGAEVFIWSDMLDPNHNAGDSYEGKNYYFLASGLYTGSWEYVPSELAIVCWWDEIKEKSLAHFSGLGHRTVAAAYYDADNLDNTRAWLKAMKNVPGASGIMYTTWEQKYDLLADFGDLVSGRH
ncbi:hypothetical protein LLH00_13430 [bacterium]|nr:hypothetical protein [bacterium]